MKSKRYTIVVADRTTGVVRRFTISLRPALTVLAVLFSLPVLMGLGIRWSARAEVSNLRTTVTSLRQENQSFRAMQVELTAQVAGIDEAIGDLTKKAKLDPDSARALAKLPQAVKSRAMGGGSTNSVLSSSLLPSSLVSPENPLGALRELLGRLTAQLQQYQGNLDQRAELLNATPSIWPAKGPLSATFGMREDPFGHGMESHTGIDISADRGDPVYSTGDGTVTSAGWNGDYGNMVVVNHNFGLETRYAHLSSYLVQPGQKVSRGEVIGLVGSTGRSTGSHLHYELLVNGRLTDPVSLLNGGRRP